VNWQIAGGLVASMIGGTLVALISYLSARDKVRAETHKVRGQRVRLSAMVKTREARHAALWMRVDGPNEESLAFDNMSGRHAVRPAGVTTRGRAAPRIRGSEVFDLLVAGRRHPGTQ